ncbi:MAG: M1 family peptidase, partial [Christiangramia sp.]
MKNLFLCFAAILFVAISNAQIVGSNHSEYTQADTLRGSLRQERTSFDVQKYHLKLKVEPEKKFISGSNVISFKVIYDMPRMQLDLFDNMEIDSIVHQGKKLKYERKYNAVFIDFKKAIEKGSLDSLEFFYHGNPVIAKNAPWDGGFVWREDKDGNPWVGVAVQGTGASLWYPNKDHQSDEPEEARMDIAVP